MKKNFIILLFISALFFNMFNVLAVDNVNYNSDELTIATFFTKDYYKSGDGVDTRIGLYTTSDGVNFSYIGETGLTGRDARVIYLNGVFYMATTKGGTDSGGFVFNVFKSTDLINWTLDTTFPYVHRYDIGISQNNKYGLPTNNWGPKWLIDGSKLYLSISSTRFDEAGSKYYYVWAGWLYDNTIKESIWNSNNYTDKVVVGDDVDVSTFITEYDRDEDNKRGILVKESAVLNNNRAQYIIGNSVYYTRDAENNIYNMNNEKLEYDGVGKYTDSSNNCIIDVRNSNKLTCNDSKVGNLEILTKKEIAYLDDEVQNIKCPWFNYPLFDIFISEVELGTLEQQRDINYQNLTFKNFRKVNLKGYDYNPDGDTFNGYAFRHSTLAGPIVVGTENDEYKYAMYLKSDPFGTVQRWLSNDLEGEWIQIDDRFYPKNYVKIGNSYYISDSTDPDADNKYVCKSVVKVTQHDERAKNVKNTSQIMYKNLTDIDSTYGIAKHFEGSFFETFNGKMYFYSDHYDASSEVSADTSDEDELVKKNKHYGIHYSVLSTNDTKNGVNYTNLNYSNDHIRFNIFHTLNINNTDMRPSDLVNSSVRNGGVYRADSDNMNDFKNIVLNASKFNLFYTLYSTNDDNKVIAVVKSNRAINNDNNQQSYTNGWIDISNMKNDSTVKNLNQELVNHFAKFDTSVPYTSKELYLYKIMDKDITEELTVTDRLGNHKSISINTGNKPQDVDIDVDPAEDNDDPVVIDDTPSEDEEKDNNSKDGLDQVDVTGTGSNISLILLIFGITFIVTGLLLFPFALKNKND